MDNLTIRLHWRGPYLLEEVCRSDIGNGLYLLTGKRKYERNEQIQYCGITESLYKNRFKQHHKIFEITRDLGVWLGEVVYPQEHSYSLEIAESIIVYFWQPNLNERKRIYPPRPTALLSHWFKNDGAPRYNQLSIYADLHDVLCWDGELWRSGNLRVWSE
ncbi:hypothetical protein [Billgrantia bachuensis]|uniref:GIY-YIG homing endonuclease n=1 Tax=Billgrantia bachuensis TaxID=2717286 RepID=A0ABX0PUD8_9GAMM|nr:hypothetical protein [Halomonas bachuensis]NIC06554.1 hypothetical protein [Halomonas bachuensis]